MSYEDFGLRLKLIRRYHKLTQDDISKQLNISRQAYSNYEQGRCLPPPDTLAKICILLNTNLFSYFIQKDFQNNLDTHIKNQACFSTKGTNKSRKDKYHMTKKDFATVLTEKRIAAGYTQAQAADALYLSRSTYNHYEKGTRLPSAEVLVQISVQFKIDPMELILPLIHPEDLKDYPFYKNILPNSKLTVREKQILAYYRSLENDEQKAILNMACLLSRTHSDLN
ncbi:MAG: helix-turn-helix domain-containing protein [Lachnospiraceae bacterium]|nr:helix-turn-helix domain-containing protein [Lachnospiraceae bacterium]